MSKAFKVMGVSRDTFYRYQELVEEGGLDALIDKNRRSPSLKNRVDEATEQARDTIYRHRQLIKEGGIEALRRQETPDLRHKNRPEEELEKIVIEFSLKNPHLGQAQVSRQLKAKMDIEISPAGVRYIWLRENMNTAALRLAKLELLPKSA